MSLRMVRRHASVRHHTSSTPDDTALSRIPRTIAFRRFLAIAGPGLVVMFADTDAGSIITAAQSGAQWGYRLLPLQLILIPVLFIVQELTVRLGILTGKGHGELIAARFGRGWAMFSVSTLMLACVGALISEFSGISGVGAVFGIPPFVSVGAAILFLSVVVWTGSYRSVERVALLLGLFELAFLIVAWQAHPSLTAIVTGFTRIPVNDRGYLLLAAANVGAVIMPWMVFYQQSAVIDKGLKKSDLSASRWDTAWGALLTQIVMAAVLIATAATIGNAHGSIQLDSVEQIAQALTPYLGKTGGTLLFAMGMLGASLIAAIVVSLTASWGLGEVFGYQRSLEHHPREAPWFYLTYTLVLIGGGILVTSGVNLVRLSIAVEVMNALLLPIVLGFLYALALTVLPAPYRLRGWYAVIVGMVVAGTSCFGIYAGGYTTILTLTGH